MDWDKIRVEYEHGATTRFLGEKYGVDHLKIWRRAKKEGWSVSSESETETKSETRVSNEPSPFDPGSKWSPKLGCFVSKVVDGKFSCLKCGYRSEDLSDHTCDAPDLWTGYPIREVRIR